MDCNLVGMLFQVFYRKVRGQPTGLQCSRTRETHISFQPLMEEGSKNACGITAVQLCADLISPRLRTRPIISLI